MVKCLPNSSTKHQSLRPNWKTFLLDDDIITAIAGILVWTLFLFYDSIWSLLIVYFYIVLNLNKTEFEIWMKRLSVCVLERSRRASPSERSITLDLHNVHFTQSAPRPENNNNNMTKTMRKTKNAFFLRGGVFILCERREMLDWSRQPCHTVYPLKTTEEMRNNLSHIFHQHIIKHLFALWFTLGTFSDVVNVSTFSSHIICYTSLTVPFVSVQQNNAVWELHLKLKWFIILPHAEHLFLKLSILFIFFFSNISVKTVWSPCERNKGNLL